MAKRKKRVMSFKKKQIIAGYVFILPLILGAVILFLPNMVNSVVFSLNDIDVGNNGYTLVWKGFRYYYEALFVNADFIEQVLLSLKDMLVSVPVIIVFSLFIASLLNQKFHGRVVARAIFFLPVIIATGLITKVDMDYNLVTNLSNRTELEVSGQLMNMAGFLSSLNFNETLIKIVVNAANGISTVVVSSGMQIFILLTAFQEIPISSYEAAMIEGASKWEIFWKITIPSISKQIIVTAIYTVIDIFAKTDNAIFNFISKIGFEGAQYGLAMAMSIIYLLTLGIMVAIIMLAISRMMRKEER